MWTYEVWESWLLLARMVKRRNPLNANVRAIWYKIEHCNLLPTKHEARLLEILAPIKKKETVES